MKTIACCLLLNLFSLLQFWYWRNLLQKSRGQVRRKERKNVIFKVMPEGLAVSDEVFENCS